MTNYSVAIIILNYESINETKRLVNSIWKHEHIINPHIYIIDNASNDAITLRENPIERCEIILLNTNGGYAAGNNIGLRMAVEAGFDYIFIANSDTEVIEDNTIYRMICAMIENDVCIIGPGIVDEHNRIMSTAGRITRFGKVKEIKIDKPITCQNIIGAFFALKSEVIESIGYINEDYFLYLEETDYFLNAYRNGYKSLYFPMIKVKHYCGITTSKVYDYYISRNRFLIAERNFNTSHIMMTVYLFFEYIITDIRQMLACILKIRNYDVKYRRKKRWLGFYDGTKHIIGRRIDI